MTTKKQLIKKIKNLGEEGKDFENLSSMSKTELEQLLEYLEKVDTFEKEEEVDFEFEEEIIMGTPIDDKQTEIDPLPEPEEEKVLPEFTGEYVEHKQPSELSKREQREYARTGILPVKKK